MTDSIEITPCGPLEASIRPPGSKSITNRALICAALANGKSTLTGALRSEDTQVMIAALRDVGVSAQEHDDGRQLDVGGSGGNISTNSRVEIDCRNSGTSIRFLTAMLATSDGEFRLDGVPRMRQRPIEDLLSALRKLGADCACEQPTGCPPVIVRAAGLSGGKASVRGNLSSQFLSALLLAAPRARSPVTLSIEGELVSKPYVSMTAEVMRSFGVEVQHEGSSFVIDPQAYIGRQYAIEPDASAASYFFAAAAIAGGEVTVQGLSRDSLQGDTAFVEVLSQMGCNVSTDNDSITVRGPGQQNGDRSYGKHGSNGRLRGVNVNMNAISDTVQTLAAVALFADGPTTVTDVAHVRHKETDRLSALATELRKLGTSVDERPDGLTITPRPLRGAAIDTYDDHRMAMSLALVGLRVPGVVINNPGCVAKTYPEFFEDLRKVCGG